MTGTIQDNDPFGLEMQELMKKYGMEGHAYIFISFPFGHDRLATLRSNIGREASAYLSKTLREAAEVCERLDEMTIIEERKN